MKKIILVCDRCGNELPNTDSTDIYNGILVKTDFSGNITRRSTMHYIKMVSYTTTSGDGSASRSDEERVHFCDKCKEEFRIFFNDPFLEAENDKREKAKLNAMSKMEEYVKEQMERSEDNDKSV